MRSISKQVKQEGRTANVDVHILFDFIHGLPCSGFRRQVDDGIRSAQRFEPVLAVRDAATDKPDLVPDTDIER